MHLFRGRSTAPAERYLSGRPPEVLSRIREPDAALVIWKRRLTRAHMVEASRLMPPEGTVRQPIAADEDLAAAVDAAVDVALPDGSSDALPVLRRDILFLLEQARRASPQSRSLQLRISRVPGDGCRLFHVDQVCLRLVCTYLGAGTQWLPEHAVRRSALGQGNNDSVLDWRAVQQIATGDVAIMKGERYARWRGGGLVHRSPPGVAGEERIFVVIDLAL